MHNCNEVREQLTERLLDGDIHAEELADGCEQCRAEFEELAVTLRMTNRLRETVTLNESYWTSYHAQLRQRLTNERASFYAKAQRLDNVKAHRKELKPGLGFVFAALRPALRLSVKTLLTPLPVPLGVAILAVGLVVALFAVQSIRQPATQSPAPIVVQVPVEVPVIQEKVVTQVVYRDRKPASRTSRRAGSGPTSDDTVARSQKPRPEVIPAGFSGFKPTDEVKFTVIKGGAPNEK